MSSTFKLKPTSTTFVDSGHANKNFSKDKHILTGSIHKSSASSIMFKSLIKFDLSQVPPFPINNAYLCLYVNDINSDTTYYSNYVLSAYKNISNYNEKTVTWNSTPKTDSPINFIIDKNNIGKYVKINITHFINIWVNSNHNYGLTLEPNNFYSSLFDFSSINSKNQPWLLVDFENSNCIGHDNITSNKYYD